MTDSRELDLAPIWADAGEARNEASLLSSAHLGRGRPCLRPPSLDEDDRRMLEAPHGGPPRLSPPGPGGASALSAWAVRATMAVLLTGLFSAFMLCLTAAKRSGATALAAPGAGGEDEKSGEPTFDFEFVTVTLLQELGKLLVSFTCLAYEAHDPATGLPTLGGPGTFERLADRLATLRPGAALLYGIPGLLYCVDNNFQYVILGFLQPAELAVLWNFKMFATVVLMQLFLNRRYAWHQWAAMLVLVAGCALTQASDFTLHGFGSTLAGALSRLEGGGVGGGPAGELGRGPAQFDAQAPSAAPTELPTLGASTKLFGAALALLGSSIAASSNVFIEWLVKQQPKESIHLQNMQLYSFGVVFNFTTLLAKAAMEPNSPMHGPQGFFTGYNIWVWLLVLLGAVSGIAISAALKYVDNLVLIFSHAMSVILVSVASTILFGAVLPPPFVAGGMLIVLALVIFHSGEDHKGGEGGGGLGAFSNILEKAVGIHSRDKPFERMGRSLDAAVFGRASTRSCHNACDGIDVGDRQRLFGPGGGEARVTRPVQMYCIT
mmetsp:Transcript_61972/g.177761  ORF Transcript_61972/g.177761 Transcript_61972/m.177761 type:complete len:549 (+) Transcript_61972:193-1839(+)